MHEESASQQPLLPIMMVGIGGAAGSGLRWLVTTSMGADNGLWAIFIVNIAGSLLLGLLVAQPGRAATNLSLLLGVGFAGGLTTFSTFAVDIARQLDDGAIGAATLNGIATTAATLLAAGIGYRLGRSAL